MWRTASDNRTRPGLPPRPGLGYALTSSSQGLSEQCTLRRPPLSPNRSCRGHGRPATHRALRGNAGAHEARRGRASMPPTAIIDRKRQEMVACGREVARQSASRHTRARASRAPTGGPPWPGACASRMCVSKRAPSWPTRGQAKRAATKWHPHGIGVYARTPYTWQGRRSEVEGVPRLAFQDGCRSVARGETNLADICGQIWPSDWQGPGFNLRPNAVRCWPTPGQFWPMSANMWSRPARSRPLSRRGLGLTWRVRPDLARFRCHGGPT